MEHHGPTSWMLSLPFLPKEESTIHVNSGVVVFLVILVGSILANLALRRRGGAQVVPDKRVSLVNVVDAAIENTHGFLMETLGKGREAYFPFCASLFFFILASNLIGLIPNSHAPTSSTNTTFALGILSFVLYNIAGIRANGLGGYLKHFLMGLGPFGIFIALLEMVSHSARPLSLGIRLFVNMFVDHAVLLTFQDLVAWLLPAILLIFGIAVSMIQAFVFAVLTAVYIQMATEHDH